MLSEMQFHTFGFLQPKSHDCLTYDNLQQHQSFIQNDCVDFESLPATFTNSW